VNAVLYMRVMDPAKAVIEIEDYLYATSQLAQTTLRSVLGEVSSTSSWPTGRRSTGSSSASSTSALTPGGSRSPPSR
jgi:regulator of protease activity HflC (stomatin/prohibitin superfamily)